MLTCQQASCTVRTTLDENVRHNLVFKVMYKHSLYFTSTTAVCSKVVNFVATLFFWSAALPREGAVRIPKKKLDVVGASPVSDFHASGVPGAFLRLLAGRQ